MSPLIEPGAQTIAVIPARLGSRRLPQKPLCMLGDAPLVWRVYERVVAMDLFDGVVVATDDARVADVITARGGQAMVIDHPCDSGTERVARAAQRLNVPYVVNVQGDMPFVEKDDLASVLIALRNGCRIVTVRAPWPEGCTDSNRVRVVADREGRALYFSRAAIPGQQHLGVYGFAASALQQVAFLPRSPLAVAEDLEQLTWLESGWPIHLVDAQRATLSVDTPADLTVAQRQFDERRHA